MALLDGYADAARYRAAVGDKASGTDATLNAQLVSVSRLLEKSLRVMPGGFNSHTATYTFDTIAGPVLRLRDRAGYGAFLQSVVADGIGVDWERDGTYDGYELDFDDAWVRGLPENAVAGSEPFTAIELLRHISGASPATWLQQSAGVQINGTWGWPTAVPGLIADLVVHRTRELRDSLKAGSTGELADFEGGAPMQRNTTWMFKEAERLYGRRIPAMA